MKLDHLKSIWKFEFSNSCALWTIKLSLKFFRINWSRFRPHFQIESVPHNLFYKCVKLQKFWMLGGICLKGLNRAIPIQFQTALSSFRLTLIPLWNFITSQILGDGVCMSTWWERNIYSSVWNTLCQIWISGVFMLEGPTSLSGQLLWVWNTPSPFLPLVKKLLIFE
jgi:hypothetical protein